MRTVRKSFDIECAWIHRKKMSYRCLDVDWCNCGAAPGRGSTENRRIFCGKLWIRVRTAPEMMISTTNHTRFHSELRYIEQEKKDWWTSNTFVRMSAARTGNRMENPSPPQICCWSKNRRSPRRSHQRTRDSEEGGFWSLSAKDQLYICYGQAKGILFSTSWFTTFFSQAVLKNWLAAPVCMYSQLTLMYLSLSGLSCSATRPRRWSSSWVTVRRVWKWLDWR